MNNVGEKLRQLRQERNLTQPELADALGIEQSYLSKLETGKSLPSGEVLNRILEVFGLSLEGFIADFDEGTRRQLRHIPLVADHFTRQKHLLIDNRKRWLLLSTLLLALGSTLVYGGSVHFFVDDMAYYYRSNGIVRAGESKLAFEEEYLAERLDEDFLTLNEYRGAVFNIPVDGGSRTYTLMQENGVDPWQNKAVAMLGVFMLVLGLAGFGLERKLAQP